MTRLSVNEFSSRHLLELAMAAGVRWRAAGRAMTRLSVNEVSRRRLLELVIAAGVMDCVGARLMEL